jgi:hypothetical protein
LQAVGDQGRAGVAAQLRPGAVEVAADLGAVQDDHALNDKWLLVTGNSSMAAEHVLAHG